MSENKSQTKAGFVALIGAPNAGKSTLLNAFLGEKLAIVTPKAQTTRVNMRGILTRNNTQFIFVDTPGIHQPKNKRLLDKSMVQAAWQAGTDADITVFLLDATKGFSKKAMDILEAIKPNKNSKIFLAINKVDKMEKEELLPLMQEASELNIFDEVFAISAFAKDGLDYLLERIEPHMPNSPYLYSEDDITDMPMRLLTAEITREQAFILLNQELPYGVAVETVSYEIEEETGKTIIHQNVLIEREAHKGMIVGKGGSMIKKIGERSRKNIAKLTRTPVQLFLKVKVSPNWAQNRAFMKEIGLDLK